MRHVFSVLNTEVSKCKASWAVTGNLLASPRRRGQFFLILQACGIQDVKKDATTLACRCLHGGMATAKQENHREADPNTPVQVVACLCFFNAVVVAGGK